MPTLSIIAAVARNGVIGCRNRMPWHISEDLRFFKRVTMGHPVVMGRKTFESVGSRPLPGRENVIITRRNEQDNIRSFSDTNTIKVVHSLEQALALFSDKEEVFVIGGGEIYRQAMPLADKLYLTRIDEAPQGDTYFPEVETDGPNAEWRLEWSEEHPRGKDNPVGFAFVLYSRI